MVACITPYNFPLVNMAGKVGPALAMGNTVVVKPAPQDPLAVLALSPTPSTRPGSRPASSTSSPAPGPTPARRSSTSPDVDMVSFTGSTAVGRRIGEVAGRDMKRLLLELGGKGAAVVFDDADLDTAVGAITSVWAFHSGQICTAPTRVIAQRGIHDQLVAGLAGRRRRASRSATRSTPDTVVGPVISAAQRDRIEGYVRAGADEGARWSPAAPPRRRHRASTWRPP